MPTARSQLVRLLAEQLVRDALARRAMIAAKPEQKTPHASRPLRPLLDRSAEANFDR